MFLFASRLNIIQTNQCILHFRVFCFLPQKMWMYSEVKFIYKVQSCFLIQNIPKDFVENRKNPFFCPVNFFVFHFSLKIRRSKINKGHGHSPTPNYFKHSKLCFQSKRKKILKISNIKNARFSYCYNTFKLCLKSSFSYQYLHYADIQN